MDLRDEVSEFLRSRRARVTPAEVGLAAGGLRRVPGLRREEVAVLASISVDWYVRIERGNLAGVSDDVLAALSRALLLDEAESAHLADLARAAQSASRGRSASVPAAVQVSPGIRAIVDAMQGIPAWVRDQRFDILATNALARGLNDAVLRSPIASGNIARFVFLDPGSRDFYRDWTMAADDVVAVLRGYVGASPDDAGLSDLVGELATRSPEFTSRWARHDVRYHRHGLKRLHHGVVGDLDLSYEALLIPDRPTLSVFVYRPADAPTRERLRLLESWVATEDTAGVERAELELEPD